MIQKTRPWFLDLNNKCVNAEKMGGDSKDEDIEQAFRDIYCKHATDAENHLTQSSLRHYEKKCVLLARCVRLGQS